MEEWRRQDAARKAEAEANRERLWAEAIEREKLLAEAMGREEAGRALIEEIAEEIRVAFVVHSDEMARALKTFAEERTRLIRVVPGKGMSATSEGIKGSWLIFEASE